ncbi:MAG: N-acetyl sugar amidotransferase [Lentisphaerae bacterium]|nr:N-acetyl sugar amidotransferase [Lentisphaerota bacterium]
MLADRLKSHGRRRDYDCIVGLSGGVDSSYVAYLAHELGLRALCVHLDNGWDSELSVENIRHIVEKLGYDLHTHVINWPEFKDLQRAFLQASVIDIELITDQAIKGLTRKLARKTGIKYILTGSNINTEHGMPPEWLWYKDDLRNLKAIHRRFGTVPLKTFPTYGITTRLLDECAGRVRVVRLLDMANYRKSEAMQILKQNLDWRYYGGKHHESTFTKFYQAYILPAKFNVDKRRVHYSSLIRNGEISREEALREVQAPPYEPDQRDSDRTYVLKKLGYSEAEFEAIMATPPRPHSDFPSMAPLLWLLKPARALQLRLTMGRQHR